MRFQYWCAQKEMSMNMALCVCMCLFCLHISYPMPYNLFVDWITPMNASQPSIIHFRCATKKKSRNILSRCKYFMFDVWNNFVSDRLRFHRANKSVFSPTIRRWCVQSTIYVCTWVNTVNVRMLLVAFTFKWSSFLDACFSLETLLTTNCRQHTIFAFSSQIVNVQRAMLNAHSFIVAKFKRKEITCFFLLLHSCSAIHSHGEKKIYHLFLM